MAHLLRPRPDASAPEKPRPPVSRPCRPASDRGVGSAEPGSGPVRGFLPECFRRIRVRLLAWRMAAISTAPPRWRTVGTYGLTTRSEEHTSELQSLMRISYAVFCLKKKKQHSSN